MPYPSARIFGACVLLALTASVLSAQSSATTGLYTTAQAERGKVVYAQFCAACHGPSLGGGQARPLAGLPFQISWGHVDMKLDDLYYIVRTTMPPNAAKSLSPEDHAAVTAFILQSNGFAGGATPLGLGNKDLQQRFPWAGKFRSTYGRTADLSNAPSVSEEFIAGEPSARPAISGPDQATLNAAGGSKDWLVYNHDYAGTRHSPLGQINADNAARLAPVAIFQVAETDNFQTGPIVHNGVMYFTTQLSTFAIDAVTGRPKWKYTWTPRANTVWERNRGVGVKSGYVVRATPDGYLLALNAATGALVWARHVSKPELGETFSMAPILYDDLVLVGPAGSENNIKGWVGAFKLSDGSPVWRFNTIPQAGEPGYETWQNPQGIPMGGGAFWTSFSLDPATGDLHVPVGNPSPDLPVQLRKGDNLYTNAIVTLDVRTGKLRWHRQIVPADSHDWDLTHTAPLFSTTIKGVARNLVATAGKDGILRAIDRKTHEVMYATPVTTLENVDKPVATTPTYARPGVLGGVEWSGPAYSPETNMLYVPAVDWGTTFTAFEEARFIPGKNYMGGLRQMDPADKAQGWVTAVDASTGDVKWKYRSPRPMVAAVTATAGNLLLTGELTGDFLVFDARNGKELFRFNTGGSMGGGVITYEVAGKQYIAVDSGSPSAFWTDQFPGAPTVVIFALR